MSGRGLRIALLLHPAAYRRERGDELAAVFADVTAGAGRWSTARELADLAGHGLRLRTGLGSDGLPARLAALAAPFAATAAVAGALTSQLTDLVRWQQRGILGLMLQAQYGSLHLYLVGQAGLLLSLLAAVAAVSGRWTAARLSGLLGLLTTLTGVALLLPDTTSWAEGRWSQLASREVVWHGPQVLWVLILLAAPRDLLGPPSRHRTWTAVAGALLGGVVLNAALGLDPVTTPGGSLGSELPAVLLGTAEIALVALAVPALLRGRYGPAAAALAGSPVAFLMFFMALGRLWNAGSHAATLALLGVAVLLAVAFSRWRPTLPDRSPH